MASGAAIEIDGSGLTIAEPIASLIGTGVGGAGALRNLANANTWSGAITLGAGGATVNERGGTLTLSGGVTGDTRPLTVDGAGDTTISGVIGTTSGTLTKTGTGTLTLAAPTPTPGPRRSARASSASSRTRPWARRPARRAWPAARRSRSTAPGSTIAEPIASLIGTGVGGAGALRNLANANTWSGAITLGAGGATVTGDGGHPDALGRRHRQHPAADRGRRRRHDHQRRHRRPPAAR